MVSSPWTYKECKKAPRVCACHSLWCHVLMTLSTVSSAGRNFHCCSVVPLSLRPGTKKAGGSHFSISPIVCYSGTGMEQAYTNKSLRELMALCDALGIPGADKAESKAQLIEMLKGTAIMRSELQVLCSCACSTFPVHVRQSTALERAVKLSPSPTTSPIAEVKGGGGTCWVLLIGSSDRGM